MENNMMRGNDAEMTTAEQAAMSGEGGNGVFAGDRGEGTPGGTGAAGVPGMDRFAGRDTRGAGSGMEGGMDRDDMPIEDWASVELGLPEGAADAAILEDFGRAAVDMGLTPRQARALARWHGGSEEAFRRAVCQTARKYLGVQYRWGGKAWDGLDCSGLVSDVYMQNGVLIYRNAQIRPGWPVRAIPRAAMQPGDALYFPGHIALYLGEQLYIHSTGAAASGGVVLNSLDPASSLYRADLDEKLTAVGTIF